MMHLSTLFGQETVLSLDISHVDELPAIYV